MTGRRLPASTSAVSSSRSAQHLRDRNPDDEGAFAFGLDLILDGLARIRDATAPGVA